MSAQGTGQHSASAAVAPSLPGVRVEILRTELARRAASQPGRLPLIVATGRTGTGKSTLGNLLVGSRYLLRSTGYADCTDRAQVVHFGCGLGYVDLPGIASNDLYENLNRVALGLPQQKAWPLAARLPVDVCSTDGVVYSREYQADTSAVPFVDADVVYYLLAAHHQFGYDDRAYLADLLAHHRQRPVLFVLNQFTDAVSGQRRATPHNVEDIVRSVRATYDAARRAPGTFHVVEIDCRTGAGIDQLLEETEKLVGPDLGTPLSEVIRRQRAEAPGRYAKKVRAYVAALLADLAAITPSSEADASERLTSELEHVLGLFSRGPDRQRVSAELGRLAPALVATLREEVTKPVYRTVSIPVYEDVPVYQTIKETDYGKPKYRSEPVYEWRTEYDDVSDISEMGDGLRSMLSGTGFKVPKRRKVLTGYEEVLVGYGKSKREVFSHTERRHTRTETGQELAGVEVVGFSMRPLGALGAAAGVAVCACVVDQGRELRETVDHAAALLTAVLANNPEPSAVAAALANVFDQLVGPAFDAAMVNGQEDDRPGEPRR